MEWKPAVQGTYGPNMNAFWLVVVEIWTFKNLNIKLWHSVTWTWTWTQTTRVTAIALLVLHTSVIHTGELKIFSRKLWTLMQGIKYAAKIIFIWVLFYWRSFDEQQAHGPHLLTWVNSYKILSMRFSLLVAMVLPNYPFGCDSNQSNSAFWTKCIYSVEDYSSNISIKHLSTYLQWVRNKGLLSFFPHSGGSSLSSSSTSSARGCSSSSASSLVDCVWASPFPKCSFTISSSSCIGIINIDFMLIKHFMWANYIDMSLRVHLALYIPVCSCSYNWNKWVTFS